MRGPQREERQEDGRRDEGGYYDNSWRSHDVPCWVEIAAPGS